MKTVRSLRRSRGISLVEILVSVAIGLVVVAAVLVSYLGAGKAGRYQAALSQMNQDAQIGLNLLAREFQLAGYSQPSALTNVNAANPAVTPSWVVSYNLGTVTAPVFGCDGTRGTVPFVTATAAVLSCGPSVTPTVSAFEVVYEADAKNTVPNAAGVPTDCLGAAIAVTTPPAGNPYYVTRNRYFIDRSTGANASGRPELYCASDRVGGSKQPLLENVEDMQVWYGMQAAAGTRQVVRYAKAGKDNTTASTVNAVGAAEWANVISVRICLLMRSAEPIFSETAVAAGNEDTLTYQDCDGVTQTSTDRYMRRAYFTTSTLRSKMAF
jgi:type IV pilus assembly protein PilW